MKLWKILESEWSSGGPSTAYLGKFPALASVYNYGYTGYYKGPEQDIEVELDQQSQDQMIDQAIDLMYSRFPEIVANKKMKRHMLQMLIGKITQGELRDKVDMEAFIKRLKKTKGVEIV